MPLAHLGLTQKTMRNSFFLYYLLFISAIWARPLSEGMLIFTLYDISICNKQKLSTDQSQIGKKKL